MPTWEVFGSFRLNVLIESLHSRQPKRPVVFSNYACATDHVSKLVIDTPVFLLHFAEVSLCRPLHYLMPGFSHRILLS